MISTPRSILVCALTYMRFADLPSSIAEIEGSASISKARVYADVNVIHPKEYWDYESLTVQWGKISPVLREKHRRE
ncbi:casein kinase II subunit alpha-2-like [Dendrobium catenatum]|uniref:casein kinase II subunit alpha-2-like n=1 Tax=Dendrobium catenatum TaxID=906689 RepID=UPI0010A023A4|nr:casein kinase II subunit alpha-2-like [Dendrobium catenatum]